MPRSSKIQSKPKRARRQVSSKNEIRISKFLPIGLVRLKLSAHERHRDFLSRRPHRSFRRSKRRDYIRSLEMPGYWAFTAEVVRAIRRNWKSLVLLGVIYAFFSVVFLGISSQLTFTELRAEVIEAGVDAYEGDWNAARQAVSVTIAAFVNSMSRNLSLDQQVVAGVFVVLVWLTTVWLLRHRLAGQPVKLRDALYNAGAPLVSTAALFVVFLIQLIPVALAVISYLPAKESGLLDGGVATMMFWAATLAAATLSAYWLSSTAIAMIAVTNQGVYPMRALYIAGDMVVGRRLRILLRILWLFAGVALSWFVVLVSVIAFDAWIKNIWDNLESLPIVPITFLILSVMTLIVTAVYLYLLYRKVVSDNAKPA